MIEDTGTRAPIAYRPDIDGLRALSVIGVLFYHARLPPFSAGYLGVDVFFVISGFLITRLLIAPGEQSLSQRLGHFYLRRGRRILPALLVVMTVSTCAALWLLLPGDLIRYGRFLGFASGLLANVGAMYEGTYFLIGESKAPLLHLWSIAVEEQFYLLYPLVLFGLLRATGGMRRVAFLLLWVASFGLWLWGSAYHPPVTFYLAPTRAWELLLGAVLALGLVPGIANRTCRELLAGGALLSLLVCFCIFDDANERMGWYALPPTLAAAALIAVGESGECAVTRCLSWRPLVFIGLISYSLYLWHAPMFTLVRYWHVTPLSPVATAGLIGATFVLAVPSWRLIEMPVRSRAVLRSNSGFVALALLLTAGLFCAARAIETSGGFPGRIAPTGRTIIDAGTAAYDPDYRCFQLPTAQISAGEFCHFGPTDARLPKVLLWGDSHAGRSRSAFVRLAYERGFQLNFAGLNGCRPLIGVVSPNALVRNATSCDEFNRGMLSGIARLSPVLVILDANWLVPTDGLVRTGGLTIQSGDSLFSRGMQETLRGIDTRRTAVCAVLGTPLMNYSVPYALVMAERRGLDDSFIGVLRDDIRRDNAAVDDALHELERRGLLRVVDPKNILCAAATCRYRDAAGLPLYNDTNHLSLSGAKLIQPELARCLQGVLPDVR
jgi:peptidoglycan/LPS O-acetylase OafA/YrhL